MVRGTATFTGAAFYGAGSQQEGVVIADLDGDGDGDLAVINRPGDLRILFNNGDGTFGPAVLHPGVWASGTTQIAAADLDRDGDIDLVATFTTLSGAVSILLNNGDGTFASPVNYATCYSTQAVVLGELNGDLVPDTASASNCSKASILLGNGDGTFRDNGDYGTGYTPRGIDSGDLDGDGDRDVVYTNGTSTLTVVFNDGRGAFGGTIEYESHDQPEDVAIADVDGDGDNDIVSVHLYSDDADVFENDGTGVFGAPLRYATGDGSEGVAVSDLDLDGDVDLAVANRFGGTVSFLFNAGDGSFAARTVMQAGAGAEDVAIGDLNGDARPDVAVTHWDSDRVAVYLNTTPAAPDQDGDGIIDASDCAPGDRSVWALPSDILDLGLTGGGATELSWSSPVRPGAARPVYDLLRSTSPASFLDAACIESGETGRVASDGTVPAAAFFYLVRTRNSCGGNLGTDSNGTPHIGPDCP